MKRTFLFVSLLTAALAAHAVDGEILVTQAKALAGNVTPGDAPGFPVTLSLPGKYKLAGNLAVTDADTTAVLITSSDVTLDLNGFALEGPVQCKNQGNGVACNDTGTGIGIAVSVPQINHYGGTAILNGTVRGFGSHAIHAGQGSTVERMRLLQNGGHGIIGEEVILSGSLIAANRLHGVYGNGFNLHGNRIAVNGGNGVKSNVTTALSDNVLTGNWAGELPYSPVQIGGNLCGASLCP